MNRLFPWGCLLLAALLLAGCRKPQSSVPVEKVPPPVQVRAYINVSSGCQESTVNFLKDLRQKYPRLNLELIDFGDGGAGQDQWQQAGLKCLTIEINGNSTVKFPTKQGPKVIAFHMPAGFMWTHEDLEQAVAAAVAGKLQPATEEEAMSGVSVQELQTKAEAFKKSKGGSVAPPKKNETKP